MKHSSSLVEQEDSRCSQWLCVPFGTGGGVFVYTVAAPQGTNEHCATGTLIFDDSSSVEMYLL